MIDPDYKRYEQTAKLLESALNVLRSDLSQETKIELLNAMGCDPHTYGRVSVRSGQLVRTPTEQLRIKIKDELKSFKYALKYLQ